MLEFEIYSGVKNGLGVQCNGGVTAMGGGVEVVLEQVNSGVAGPGRGIQWIAVRNVVVWRRTSGSRWNERLWSMRWRR